MTTLYDYVEIVRESRERTNSVSRCPTWIAALTTPSRKRANIWTPSCVTSATATSATGQGSRRPSKVAQAGYMICSAIIQVPTDHLDRFDWNPFIMAIASMTLYIA